MKLVAEAFAGVGIALACWAQVAMAEELSTDVNVQWATLTKLFPDSETGRFYPGETLKVRASGRIDRNHDYHEECHKEWLVINKCHDVSRPVWVNYSDHLLVMGWSTTTGGTESTQDVHPLSAAGATVTVPKIQGKFDAVVRIVAYVPDQPVVINRAISYSAYQFYYEIDVKPRLALLKEYLQVARTADELQRPEVLNRRLKEAEPVSIALLLIEHAANRWQGGAAGAGGERERVLKIAQDLAPGNRDVSVALSQHYLSTGNFVGAEQQVRDRMKASQAAGAAPGATSAQLIAAGADAQELATVYEKRAGLVGGREVAAAEFWYGEATKYFERANDEVLMHEALGKQAQILLRIRSMGSLEKAAAVLEGVYAKLPSVYVSPERKRDMHVSGVSQDGSMVLFAGEALPGLLVGAIDRDELPVRRIDWRATPMGVYNESVVVLADGATEDTFALKFLSLTGGEPGLVPVPVKPKKVAVVRELSALVIGEQGTKQQLWRVGPDASTKLMELELGKGWFSDSDSIQSLRANAKGSFAVVIGRSKSVAATTSGEPTLAVEQSLEIFGADNLRRSQYQTNFRMDWKVLEGVLQGDKQKVGAFFSSAGIGILGSAAVSPDGTRALAFWSAAVPSQSKWIILDGRGSPQTLQVPGDKVLIAAGPEEKSAGVPVFPLEMFQETEQTSSLFPASPPGLPPQGWTHASFTSDGQRIIVSNWVGGVLVFDLDGRLLNRIEIPRWLVTTQTQSGEKKATVVPFGHIWRNATEILVGGLQYLGSGTQPFLVSVNTETGEVKQAPVSRTALAQLRNWQWDEGKDMAPSPLLVSVADELRVVSLAGKEYVLRGLPSFEEIGRVTTPAGDDLIDDWPVGPTRPTQSGLMADLRTAQLSLGGGAAKNATLSIPVSHAGRTVFVDFVAEGTVAKAIVRHHETEATVGSADIALPSRSYRVLQSGECLGFVEYEAGRPSGKGVRKLSWLSIGTPTRAGVVRWRDRAGSVEAVRCSLGTKPAVLLLDDQAGTMGWQEEIVSDVQPPFAPMPGWSVVPGTYGSKQAPGDTTRFLLTRYGGKLESFIVGADAKGVYTVLDGPFDESLITNSSLSVVGTYKDGKVELHKVGSKGVFAIAKVLMKPDSVLDTSVLVKQWSKFSLWPYEPAAGPAEVRSGNPTRINVPMGNKVISAPTNVRVTQ